MIKIPKGKDYRFKITVKDKESFIPKDLSAMYTATIEVLDNDTNQSIFSESFTVLDALNGIIQCTIPATKTSLLTVLRSSKEDGYFLRSKYRANIDVSFTDGSLPIFVFVEKVYVVPTGL